MPEPCHPLDDLDPKEYALRVVTPYRMDNLEDRVRCALGRVGFEIERLIINPDESVAAFWLRADQPLAHFESLDAARAAL